MERSSLKDEEAYSAHTTAVSALLSNPTNAATRHRLMATLPCVEPSVVNISARLQYVKGFLARPASPARAKNPGKVGHSAAERGILAEVLARDWIFSPALSMTPPAEAAMEAVASGRELLAPGYFIWKRLHRQARLSLGRLFGVAADNDDGLPPRICRRRPSVPSRHRALCGCGPTRSLKWAWV